MTYADQIFKENISNILENGVFSENARPKYKNGQTANSKYITGSFVTYDLEKANFLSQLFVVFLSRRQLKNSCGFTKIRQVHLMF